MPQPQHDSAASEFERLSAMTPPDLASQVRRSLSGCGTLPTVHDSLGQSPSDVWASFLEESDPESPFAIRTRQVLSELLGELLQTDPIPAWAEGFCELLRRVGGPPTFDALRTFVLKGAFHHDRFRANDMNVDRLLLEIAATRMRTDSETNFWPGLLKDERYCDISHMALSVNMKQSIRHLQAAALALKEHPHRQRALVWVTLDRWLNQTSDADALCSELRRRAPWNSQVRRLINEWARKRDISGFELLPELEERIESTPKKAPGSLTGYWPEVRELIDRWERKRDMSELELLLVLHKQIVSSLKEAGFSLADWTTRSPLGVLPILVLEGEKSEGRGLGAYVLGPAEPAQMHESPVHHKLTYIAPEAKEEIGSR